MFDRFYRVRRPGQSQRGSASRLSLVKHIADAHGGRAWAEDAAGGGRSGQLLGRAARAPAQPEPRGDQKLNDAHERVSS